MRLTYISGGVRSGKSRYAQQLALAASDAPVYLATAQVPDADFQHRVARHQHDRDNRWTTVETPIHLPQPALLGRVVVLDCITLWLSNLFGIHKGDSEAALADAQRIWAGWQQHPPKHLIAVSNELGMGLHADTPLGRAFADAHGFLNQFIAAQADEACVMVSGLPLRLK